MRRNDGSTFPLASTWFILLSFFTHTQSWTGQFTAASRWSTYLQTSEGISFLAIGGNRPSLKALQVSDNKLLHCHVHTQTSTRDGEQQNRSLFFSSSSTPPPSESERENTNLVRAYSFSPECRGIALKFPIQPRRTKSSPALSFVFQVTNSGLVKQRQRRWGGW